MMRAAPQPSSRRAGKPAEHVRLASYSCVQKLLSADAISGEQLGAHMGGALPLLVAGLDDDNVESRRIACVILATALRRLGPSRVSHEQMRQLYPELTKRLDDASDGVRVAACVPLVAMLEQVRYSASWSEAHNFDRTNFGYFVNGLLVHLDDPDPEIQAQLPRFPLELLASRLTLPLGSSGRGGGGARACGADRPARILLACASRARAPPLVKALRRIARECGRSHGWDSRVM